MNAKIEFIKHEASRQCTDIDGKENYRKSA